MSNRYDLLYRLPVYAVALPTEQEQLARRLQQSGLLSINSDQGRNFVTYSGSGFDTSFTYRELHDPRHTASTRMAISRLLPGYAGESGTDEAVGLLKNRLKIAGRIPPERELQIARLLVQSCHPAVMQLCLIERVQIFVSYSHSVADLMPVHFWQEIGENSGLQSVSGDGTAVYVSCGGDPFIEDEKHKTYTSDGFPALARMQIIAAQELGHFADLMRDNHGQMIGRFSANFSPLRASAGVAAARIADAKQLLHWQQEVTKLNISRIAANEKKRDFYRQHRKTSIILCWLNLAILIARIRAIKTAKHQHIAFVTDFPKQLFHNRNWASNILDCLADMRANLAPDADVYRRDDPREEEAIACIEALARVPQQAIKWGEQTTRHCWPNLSPIYEEQVIAAVIQAVCRATPARTG